MRRLCLLILVFVFFLSEKSDAQSEILYIKKDVISQVLKVNQVTYPGDNILTVNMFYELGEKIPWGETLRNSTYKYLGVDNGHNLHLEKIDHKSDSDETDRSRLVFGLDENNKGNITLVSFSSLKEPVLIKLEVEANNNDIKIRYLGEFIEYQQ